MIEKIGEFFVIHVCVDGIIYLGDRKYLDFDMAVLDELSSFKANSQRTKAFLKLRPRLKRVVGLTGGTR